jgi:hypothetical protein
MTAPLSKLTSAHLPWFGGSLRLSCEAIPTAHQLSRRTTTERANKDAAWQLTAVMRQKSWYLALCRTTPTASKALEASNWHQHVMCDAFGDIGAAFRELEWKSPTFSGRVVPKTPNASYPAGASTWSMTSSRRLASSRLACSRPRWS